MKPLVSEGACFERGAADPSIVVAACLPASLPAAVLASAVSFSFEVLRECIFTCTADATSRAHVSRGSAPIPVTERGQRHGARRRRRRERRLAAHDEEMERVMVSAEEGASRSSRAGPTRNGGRGVVVR